MRTLKLIRVIFFSMIILFSCSEDSDETIIDQENVIVSADSSLYGSEGSNAIFESSRSSNRAPVDNFTVFFNSEGFETNDNEFLESNHSLVNSLTTLSSYREGRKSTENTYFQITQDGFIFSENEYYNGRKFVEVLVNDGNYRSFDQDITVVYDNNGYQSISNEEIFSDNPELRDYFINAGEGFIGNVPDGNEVAMSFIGSQLFINGEEFPLFGGDNNLLRASWYDLFKDCVGDLWWAIVINIPACAIAATMEYYW